MKSRLDFLIALTLLPLAACPGGGGKANDDTATDSTMTMSAGTVTDTTVTDPTVDPTMATADSTGPSGDAGFCTHQCTADSDCKLEGMDLGLTCQDSYCANGDSTGCASNADCIAQYSGWITPCTAGGDECEALSQVCVAVGDGGACASPPSEFFMCDAVPGFTELMVPDIDGNKVTVCGNGGAKCRDDGSCFVPCQADADCTAPAYPVCDTATGNCGCGSDTDCAKLDSPHMSVCKAGTCGCDSDQQCVDDKVGDVCTDKGLCGCSGDAGCSGVKNPFDGGTISCVNP